MLYNFPDQTLEIFDTKFCTYRILLIEFPNRCNHDIIYSWDIFLTPFPTRNLKFELIK